MEDSIVYFIYGVLFLYLLFLAYVISTNAKKTAKNKRTNVWFS